MELSISEIKVADYVQVQAEGVHAWIPCQVQSKDDQGITFFLLLAGNGYELKTRIEGDRLITNSPEWASSPGKRITIKPIELTLEQINQMKVLRNRNETAR